MTKKMQFLCTFTTKDYLESVLSDIREYCDLTIRRVFVLSVDNGGQYICTYTVHKNDDQKYLKSTIPAHRKQETNTIYTINALNHIIEEESKRYNDTSDEVVWKNYRNMVLLYNETSGLRKMPTKFIEIVNFED